MILSNHFNQSGFFIHKAKMKQLDLPFKIDKQYENWQFELDVLDDRLSGYHSYKYIGEQSNYFLNFITDETELIFNGDYLTAVIITIKNLGISEVKAINQYLAIHASKEIIIEEHIRKFKIYRVMYCTVYRAINKETLIIYGKSRFMQRSLDILL